MRKFIQQSGLVFALAAGLGIASGSRGAELQTTTSTLDQTNSLQQLSQQFLAVEQKLQTDMTA